MKPALRPASSLALEATRDSPARWLLGCVLLLNGALACRSQVPKPDSAITQQQVVSAMTGTWTGVLEYRDYKSDARVKLPTWLQIAPEGQGLRFRYIYDDGPTKVVEDSELVTIDAAKGTYAIQAKAGETADVASIAGLDSIKNGRGTLILTGAGMENGRVVDIRTNLRVDRNILEILRESRLPGEDFKFRHAYTLTRSTPPSAQVQARR